MLALWASDVPVVAHLPLRHAAVAGDVVDREPAAAHDGEDHRADRRVRGGPGDARPARRRRADGDPERALLRCLRGGRAAAGVDDARTDDRLPGQAGRAAQGSCRAAGRAFPRVLATTSDRAAAGGRPRRPGDWRRRSPSRCGRGSSSSARSATIDRAGLLSSATVYVAPQTGGESFGVVLVEAMAAGAAVVASALPAFRAVLGGGELGELFAVGDPGRPRPRRQLAARRPATPYGAARAGRSRGAALRLERAGRRHRGGLLRRWSRGLRGARLMGGLPQWLDRRAGSARRHCLGPRTLVLWTAGRLDRMHLRVEAARASLLRRCCNVGRRSRPSWRSEDSTTQRRRCCCSRRRGQPGRARAR